MSRGKGAKVLMLAALLFASLLLPGQARPAPRGGKRAFGMGLMGGALAGAVIGHQVARAPAAAAPAAQVHHYHHNAPGATTPDPKHQTIIETGAPQANGCYQQTIKEPMPGNPHMFTKTVHLVCPTLQQANQPAPVAAAPSVQLVPVMPQPVAVLPAAASNNTQAVVSSNGTHTSVLLAAPTNVLPAPSAPAPLPMAPVVQLVPAQPQPQPPAQVVVVSKSTGYYSKKKSAASSIFAPQSALAILVVFYGLKALFI